MLRKLIKHDFKAMSRLLLPMNGFIVLVTLISCLIMATQPSFIVNKIGIIVLLILAYTLVLLIISATSFIYPIAHYYRMLFTDKGYLTFTLPVENWKIYLSKLLVGGFWSSITILVSLASIFLTLLSNKDFAHSFYKFEWSQANQKLIDLYSLNIPLFSLIIVIIIIGGLFYGLSMIYFSITLGQLVSRHKILGSILSFVGLYILIQLIQLLFVYLGGANFASTVLPNLLVLVIAFIWVLFLVVVFSYSSTFILKRHVNLD